MKNGTKRENLTALLVRALKSLRFQAQQLETLNFNPQTIFPINFEDNFYPFVCVIPRKSCKFA